jgi:hypothetical protein
LKSSAALILPLVPIAAGFAEPVAVAAPADGTGRLFVGIGLYRGAISPALGGADFHADDRSGTIWARRHAAAGSWRRALLLDIPPRIDGGGQDAAGELDVAASGGHTGPYANPDDPRPNWRRFGHIDPRERPDALTRPAGRGRGFVSPPDERATRAGRARPQRRLA